MKLYQRNRLEHYLSVMISVLLNAGLMFIMSAYFTLDEREDVELKHTMVLDPVNQEQIEELSDLIIEEAREPQDPQEMQDFADVQFDGIDTSFEVVPEALDAPPAANVSGLTALLSDIASPVTMPGLMAGRTVAGRAGALREHGGSAQTEAAVRRALQWLKENQEEDGSWQGRGGANSRTGMTGLAVLTFLAHGETPGSAEYGATVSSALRFLVERAQRADGSFQFEDRGGNRGGVYAQAIATYALSEAYGMTQNVLLLEPVKKALQRIISGQREDGGFDYGYERGGGPRGRCTSVAGWQIQAMKAADLAGIDLPGLQSAMSLAARGMKLNQREDGKFIYASGTPNHAISNRNIMTAIGTLSLQILGESGSRNVRAAMGHLSGLSPESYHDEMEPVYAWYYATQAYFHQGGAVWSRWNRLFAPMAVNGQNADGSWEWELGRSGGYGPVYHTTLTALSLMVYYRYLPTMQTELIQQRPAGQPSAAEADDIILITL